MITSCTFYKTDDNVERPTVLCIGLLSLSTQELFISVISILIVFPVNLIIIQIFRKTQESSSPSPVDFPKENQNELSKVARKITDQQMCQVNYDVEIYPLANDTKKLGDLRLLGVESFGTYFSLTSSGRKCPIVAAPVLEKGKHCPACAVG